MALTFAFDVYGTLIDTHGLVSSLKRIAGEGATAFSQTWREKQLEYSFRRGLMKRYETFVRCTRDALEYTCRFYGVEPTPDQIQALLEGYRTLPAFDDAGPALAGLKTAGHNIYAFSNGTAEAVETLLVSAGIRDLFHGVISVDDVHSFKPDPGVYAHFLNTTGTHAKDAWMVSGNPFDVIGAVSAGMHAAWIRRSKETIFDPWGIEPDIVVPGLGQLKEHLI